MAESRGVNLIRQGDTSILVLAVLYTAANAKITTGAASARVWHLVPTSGALGTYDFNDNTFKTTAVTTPTLALTYRQAENATYDTGLWTARLTTLTGFVAGDKYAIEISHTSLPRPITYYFQYGGNEGDDLGAPDVVIDTTTTPGAWQLVLYNRGASQVAANELARQRLFKKDGTTAISSETDIVGWILQ